MALSPAEIDYVKRLRKAGADDENVLFYLNKRRQDETNINAPKEQGILGKTVGFLQNVGSGAIQAGGDLAFGLPGQVSRLLPGNQSADQNSFYNFTQDVLNTSKRNFEKQGVETNSKGFGLGNFIMNTAGASILSGGIVNGVSKGISLAGKVSGLSKVASVANKTGQFMNSGGFGGNVLKGAVTGANDMFSYDLAGGKELSPGNIVLGAVTGGAMPILGAGVKKTAQFLTESLPKGLIARGLTTPSALKNASERLSRLADDGVVDIDSAPQWLLDKDLTGGKKTIQDKLIKIMRTSGEEKGALLSSYKGELSQPVVQELKSAMREILPNYAKITKGKVVPTPGNTDVVKEILGFIKKKDITATELDRARTLLGNMGIFRTSGEFRDQATKAGLQNVWVATSKYLDSVIPGFRKINKDIEVAHALAKAVGLKEAQDSSRRLLGMTDILTGGLGSTIGYGMQGDVAGATKYGLLALGSKYVLNNTFVTSKTAKGLQGIGKLGLTKGGKLVKSAVKGGSKLVAPLISELKDG